MRCVAEVVAMLRAGEASIPLSGTRYKLYEAFFLFLFLFYFILFFFYPVVSNTLSPQRIQLGYHHSKFSSRGLWKLATLLGTFP